MQRIKKDDMVCVTTGKDKGLVGAVLSIDYAEQRVLVKGVNVVTRHVKPRAQGQQGKIVKEERPISLSNVMPVCPEAKKPTRVRFATTEDGKRVRVSVRSGQAF